MDPRETVDRGGRPWQRAAWLVGAARVVVVPTDTVYGLVCDPRSTPAVERIHALKRRPAGMKLNLLGATIADLEPWVVFDSDAVAIAEAFWPGPLALVLLRRGKGEHLATQLEGPSLMVRVPGHDQLRRLLRRTGPLASTSANRHGEPAATTAAEVLEQLAGEVELVVDGGPVAGTASTIIDCTVKPPRVLRQGPVADHELAVFIGERVDSPPRS